MPPRARGNTIARTRPAVIPSWTTPGDPAAGPPPVLAHHLGRLEEQFATLREHVRQLQHLAVMGTAAATMAHEYNNLMAPLVGYARFALDSDDAELMKKALRMTMRNADTLAGMSDRVMRLAVREETRLQPVVVREVVDIAVESLCRDPAKDGIRLEVNVDPAIRVHGDFRQLHQVFFNLLLNARHAIEHRHGRIEITAARAGDEQVEIRVSDNGGGILPEEAEAIFEPFFTTRRGADGRPKGCGLGLALCRDIVTEHQGRIVVQSKPGEGATFILHLPAAKHP